MNGVTQKLKFGHAVEESYRMLEQDQHTVVSKRKELAVKITAERAVLAPRPAGMLPIPRSQLQQWIFITRTWKEHPGSFRESWIILLMIMFNLTFLLS